MFENNESKRKLILAIKDHLTETLIILFYKGCLKKHYRYLFFPLQTYFFFHYISFSQKGFIGI